MVTSPSAEGPGTKHFFEDIGAKDARPIGR